MKKTLAFIVLVAWLLNCAPTLPQYKYHQYKGIYPIVISERVGETIDTEERAEYDLFLGIEGFREARFYEIVDGGYEIEIVTDRGTYQAVNRDSKACQLLQDYFLQHRNPGFNERDFEEKWGIIEYDDLGFPITKSETSMNVQHGWCIGCTAGGFLVSLPLAAIVGLVVGDMDMNYGGRLRNPEAAFLSAAGIVTAFTVFGILYGKSQDDASVVNRIKEARMPVLMR